MNLNVLSLNHFSVKSCWFYSIKSVTFNFLQMLSSGLPELSGVQDLKYVQDALQPQTTDAEATIFFTRYWISKN